MAWENEAQERRAAEEQLRRAVGFWAKAREVLRGLAAVARRSSTEVPLDELWELDPGGGRAVQGPWDGWDGWEFDGFGWFFFMFFQWVSGEFRCRLGAARALVDVFEAHQPWARAPGSPVPRAWR